jgi:hypothetical protein
MKIAACGLPADARILQQIHRAGFQSPFNPIQ